MSKIFGVKFLAVNVVHTCSHAVIFPKTSYMWKLQYNLISPSRNVAR